MRADFYVRIMKFFCVWVAVALCFGVREWCSCQLERLCFTHFLPKLVCSHKTVRLTSNILLGVFPHMGYPATSLYVCTRWELTERKYKNSETLPAAYFLANLAGSRSSCDSGYCCRVGRKATSGLRQGESVLILWSRVVFISTVA